jgi:hypothetical protein
VESKWLAARKSQAGAKVAASDVRAGPPVMPHMNAIRTAGLALLVAGISCSDASGPARQVTDLEAARQRWRAQNLHTYAFTIQRSCFCANTHPLYVLVLSDTVAGALDLQTGESVDRRLGETVEGLFTFIQNATDRPAQLIRAEYDGAKGFPTEIDYDGAAQIADDEIFYRVSDVHPVAPVTGLSLTSRAARPRSSRIH